MRPRRRTVLVGGALVALLAAAGAGLEIAQEPDAAVEAGPAPTGAPPAAGGASGSGYTTVEAGNAFLGSYVDPDGRVVRRDQGGDTVSEGQAYGMLIAVGLGDADAFDSIWSWTQQNLQRTDDLLSWHWADGGVVDASSASDADLDAARALVVAGTRFADPRYTTAGLELGRAVLDRETAQTGAGRILTAGQWTSVEPWAYNPSYASPGAFAVLAAASGDPRWTELAAGSRAVNTALLSAAPLPPDWAQVHADGRVEAMPGAQGQGQSVRYGYDAARTAIRFAESCDPADQALAASLADPLARGGDAAELDLGGSPLGETRSVVAATAGAAALAAGRDTAGAAAQLRDSDELARTGGTNYYGMAWAALGHLMLTDDALGGCPPLPASA